MPIDFFEKEVKKAQSRFNNTFGALDTCDLGLRYKAILSIIGMAHLAKKIQNESSKNLAGGYIRAFNLKKEFLTDVFTVIEQHLKRKETA